MGTQSQGSKPSNGHDRLATENVNYAQPSIRPFQRPQISGLLSERKMMMRAKQKRRFLSALLILGSFILQGSIQYREFIPLSSGGSGINSDILSPLLLAEPELFDTAQDTLESDIELGNTEAINDFISTVADGATGVIRGVYSEKNFELQIIQQPSGQAGFVSTIEGVVTQFSMSNEYGITGLLAHNYLSGRNFFGLGMGDIVQLIYGDGDIKEYQIVEIQRYQALQPDSPNSQFLDLNNGEKLSATQLFKRVYMGNHHLTLQTCIQEGSEDSWGRLFIIANPI